MLFQVAAIASGFKAALAMDGSLSVELTGELRRDRDTPVWDMLSDHFGSNPNTPYMSRKHLERSGECCSYSVSYSAQLLHVGA